VFVKVDEGGGCRVGDEMRVRERGGI